MSEHDWELDLEGFDWSVATGSDDSGPASADDAAFSEFFAQLDGVRASDEVRASALKAILADDDAPTSVVRPKAGGAGTSGRKRPAHLRRSRRSASPRPRRPRRVALAACLLLVLTVVGVGSWFLPFSQVAVAQDDLSVEFGVNLYGVTVTATAEGEVSKKVVSQASVSNRRFEDALNQVLDTYDKLRAEGDAGASVGVVTVDVKTPGGIGGEGLRREVEGAVAGRGGKGHQALPQQEALPQQDSMTQRDEASPRQGEAMQQHGPDAGVMQESAPHDTVGWDAMPHDAAPQDAVPQYEASGGEAMRGPGQQEPGFEHAPEQNGFGARASGNGPRA